jgi:dTDP-4-amino-4,6-dideoxygalactose transaminase
MVPFVDLPASHVELADRLDAAYARVMSRGRFVLGEELECFEQEFAGYCGVRHCIGVGSGLDALSLCLRAFDVGPGDEVIVPAHTFIATWLAVREVGASPVPVDLDERTYNIDPAAARLAISARTRAIVAVHLYGQPAEMSVLRELARASGVVLIEDAAQAHGATYRRRKAGSLADAAAFSFYPTKNLGALGDGGAVTTDDPEIARRVRRLRNYGSERKYVHDVAGVNSRLDELQAAFLRAKLPLLDMWNARRRVIAARYIAGLAGVPGIRVPAVGEEAEPAWHLFVVRSALRDQLAAHLSAADIHALVHYPVPPHRSGAFAGHPASRRSLPLTETLSREVLSLPIYPQLPVESVDGVIAEIRRFASCDKSPS